MKKKCKDSPCEVEIDLEVLREPGSCWPDDLGAVVDRRQPGLMPEMGGVKVGPLIIDLKGWACFLCGLQCETGNQMSSIVRREDACPGTHRSESLPFLEAFHLLPTATLGPVHLTVCDVPPTLSPTSPPFLPLPSVPSSFPRSPLSVPLPFLDFSFSTLISDRVRSC